MFFYLSLKCLSEVVLHCSWRFVYTLLKFKIKKTHSSPCNASSPSTKTKYRYLVNGGAEIAKMFERNHWEKCKTIMLNTKGTIVICRTRGNWRWPCDDQVQSRCIRYKTSNASPHMPFIEWLVVVATWWGIRLHMVFCAEVNYWLIIFDQWVIAL